MEILGFPNQVHARIDRIEKDIRSLLSGQESLEIAELKERVTKLEGELKAMKARMGKLG